MAVSYLKNLVKQCDTQMGCRSKFRKLARKLLAIACLADNTSVESTLRIANMPPDMEMKTTETEGRTADDEDATSQVQFPYDSQKLCAICLEAMCNDGDGSGDGKCRVFTAQCSHQFHFFCIWCNIRHGSVSCPICRITWTHLPRSIVPFLQPLNPEDPVAALFHPNTHQCPVRYDDDDPVDTNYNRSCLAKNDPRFKFSLSPAFFQSNSPDTAYPDCIGESSSSSQQSHCPNVCSVACVSVRLSRSRPATDVVLVVTGNELQLGIVMQSLTLVVSSLGAADRLAVVIFSRRIFSLKRMSSNGKREALQAITDFFMEERTDSTNYDLKLGMKILTERVYRNPVSFILHVSDFQGRTLSTTLNYSRDLHPAIHEFNFRFRTWNGESEIQEFRMYLESLLGIVVNDLQLRIGEEGRRLMVGEVRVNEERRIMVNLGNSNALLLRYSYAAATGGLIYGEKLLSIETSKAASFMYGDNY